TTPAFYALTVWLIGLGGHAPALVALAQLAALAALLVVAARRLTRLGVPWWLSGGVAVAIGLLPAVGNVAVTLWNDTAAGLAGLWVFVELLGLATTRRYLSSPWARYRLTAGLTMWWLYGGGGGVAAVVVVALIAVVVRGRSAYVVGTGTVIAVAAVHIGAYTVLPVERSSAHAAEILAPVVADVYRHHQNGFGSDDLRLMERVAPLDVWREASQCEDGNQLLEDRQFDVATLRADDDAFRSLGWRTVFAEPLQAIGYRLCAASFLWVPSQPAGGYFDLPSYAIPPNSFDIERDPMSWWAFNATKAVLVRTQQPDRLWLWWRPAMPLGLAAAVYLVALVRRRRLLWPAAVVAGYVGAALLTVNSPGIRPVWGLYVTAWLSLPLLWPALRRA
ncbi:MAG: hypothetical protein ACE5E8_10465, partial [Acidimicrobiia bacterium]